MKVRPSRGSHLPVLMKVMSLTNGPVLELGCGMYSSTYLHWACFPNRELVTYEDNPRWFWFAERFLSEHHKAILVKDWDIIDLSRNFSVALVDHDPITKRERSVDVARLTHVDYVVCHDSEQPRFRYRSILNLFKYKWDYTKAGLPHTLVLSNKHDVKDLL